MDRRSFLKTSALGGTAAAAGTLAAPAYAQGKRTLTMVTSWPRGFAVLDDAATYLNNMVDEMSDGTLTIDNPAAFARLLARGVGRHTTYGYGMLMLRPPGKTGQAKTDTAA